MIVTTECGKCKSVMRMDVIEFERHKADQRPIVCDLCKNEKPDSKQQCQACFGDGKMYAIRGGKRVAIACQVCKGER